MIYIIGAGTDGQLSEKAKKAIEKCQQVIIKTNLTNSYNGVKNYNHITLDEVYLRSRNFDTLNANLAKEVLKNHKAFTNVAYIVDGSGYEDKSVEILKNKAGAKVTIIPSVSKSSLLCFKPQTSYSVFSANDFAAENYPEFSLKYPLIIYEMDNQFLAGDIKLKLFKVLKEDHIVILANGENTIKVPLFEIDRQKHYDSNTSILIAFDKTTCKYNFNSLLDIMHKLRSRGGCPWDREQTHDSIKMNAVEEAYELVDAIDSGDSLAIQEETGDLLLQSVFQSKIAEDQANFDIYDVLNQLCSKLIFRHSHIFGTDKIADSEAALTTWEKNKKIEKNHDTITDSLLSIPKVFPSLIRSEKVQKRAAKCGFDFENTDEIYNKINEELNELKQAIESREMDKIIDESGDVLFSVVNLLRRIKVDAELALKYSTDKFIKRFSLMEQELIKLGKKPSDVSLEEMERLYNNAKKQLNS